MTMSAPVDLTEVRTHSIAVAHALQDIAATGVNLPPIFALHHLDVTHMAAELVGLRAELARLHQEHSGCPTRDAYTAAHAAVDKHRARADVLVEAVERVRDWVYMFGADNDPEMVRDLRERVHTRACAAVNADVQARRTVPSARTLP